MSTYDVAVVGGGLAGLALSIQMAELGYRVVVFEKEAYPMHRVCGEYISMESWDFLCHLGIPLQDWQLPGIKRLQLTAPNGKRLEARLLLGGFGVSRYKLDATLAGIARQKGVDVNERTRVEEIRQTDDRFDITVRTSAGMQIIQAKVCSGAWGKRSNLDVKWKRPFVQDAGTRISNWVGIKYHVRTTWPEDLIALHNFEDGYCGISRIEEGKCCLCYLSRAGNLKTHGQSIEKMESAVLARNPVLREILADCERLPGFPLAISQVSFQNKSRIEAGVLLLGDAAGMIAPLCGNGMSMALHGSKLAASAIHDFLCKRLTRREMEHAYENQWQKHFAGRLRMGRILQGFFGSEGKSNLMISLMGKLPFATRAVIRQTHGQPF